MRALAPRGLLVALATLGVAVAGSPAFATAAPARRPGSCAGQGFGQRLTQAGDGRIAGCIRLGPLRPGVHTAVLQEYLSFGSPPPGRPAPPPPPPSRGPAVALSLSPASGGPGTVVTVTGTLGRPLRGASSYPDVCWDGCADGIPYFPADVHWTSARSFRVRVVVPNAPWVQGVPVRVAPLASGSYPIAVACLRGAKGCDAVTEGSADFHLTVVRPVSWCTAQASCARLRLVPASARPGQLVRVTGYAPLTGISPPGLASPLQLQLLPGRRRGPEVRLSLDQAVFGRALLRAVPPPSFSSLRETVPIGQVSAGLSRIAADPADPGTVAWCSGSTVGLRTAATTTMVSTAAVLPVLKRMGLSSPPGSADCAGVAPVDDSAGTMTALAAAFMVTPPPGAPPSFDAALETTDGGVTWTPLPVPPGALADSFGDFRYDGWALTAVYSAARLMRRDPYPALDPSRPLAEISGADGRSWSAAPLGCPATGPCLTLGPYVPGNCAMNGSSQPLLRSADGGRRWTTLGFPYAVQSCEPAELAATSPRSELLVDSQSQYPLMRTVDGGRSWTDVGVPRLHGGAGQLQPGYGQGGLTVLPDGSLLFAGGAYAWEWLRHAARAWCRLRSPARPAQRTGELAPVTAIGGELWWLTFASVGPFSATLHSLPLSALAC